MNTNLLLDTSVIIDFLRQKEKADTLLYRLSLGKIDLSVSIITHTELYAGKSVWERDDARAELETVFGGLEIKPLTETISASAGQLKVKYRMDLIDTIIAATAIQNNIPLVTLNTKHFKQIENLELYH